MDMVPIFELDSSFWPQREVEDLEDRFLRSLANFRRYDGSGLHLE